MKKILAIILCCMMTVCFAACNDKKDDEGSKKKESVTSITSKPSEDVTNEVTTTEPEKKDDQTDDKQEGSSTAGMSLDAYIKLCSGQIDSMNKTLGSQGLGVDLIARDNSMVFKYTYNKQFDSATVDTMKPLLEKQMEDNISIFDNAFTELKKSVPDAKSLIIEYLNKDGSVIYSKEVK